MQITKRSVFIVSKTTQNSPCIRQIRYDTIQFSPTNDDKPQQITLSSLHIKDLLQQSGGEITIIVGKGLK